MLKFCVNAWLLWTEFKAYQGKNALKHEALRNRKLWWGKMHLVQSSSLKNANKPIESWQGLFVQTTGMLKLSISLCSVLSFIILTTVIMIR